MDIYQILEAMKFAGEPEQKAGDQWQGKDAGTPGTKLVGECDQPMTLADKLRARWEETKREKGLQEYGMTTGGTAMQGGQAGDQDAQASTDPAAVAKQTTLAQQNLNKLKSAGVNLPTGVGQAAKSAVTAVNDPTKVPSQQDKQVSMNLGGELEQALVNADPGQVQQVANVLKQVKQGK